MQKNSKKETNETSANITVEDVTTYFKASGNEPFWSIKIGKEKIVFTSLIEGKEMLVFPTVDPVRAMDANVKMYQISNADSNAKITIHKTDCQDSMSGIVSPYTVSIELKSNAKNDLQTLKGCGQYLTDYRLHDIWVLESLNGKKVETSDFEKEVPRIEIYASENKFLGYGGCNSITGTLFSEKDLLRFTNIISTMMACNGNNKEGEFIKALKSSTSYTIENNRLSLSNPSGNLLVLRKVD
ncbi:META domain-containing protein [Flavobacterium sp. W22_SRS_FK3]|uniref:META domain-containing protein n=1 Tax=Flavobacterium sp. W22_SRS_FK3 TaxID=3240275 RepID=UPI003F8FFC7C